MKTRINAAPAVKGLMIKILRLTSADYQFNKHHVTLLSNRLLNYNLQTSY